MKTEENQLSFPLGSVQPAPKPISEKAYTICGVVLYPVWGLVALLLDANVLHGPSLTGVAIAGLLPLAAHIYEVKIGKTFFEWKTLFISVPLGGFYAVYFGNILQSLLLLCGVHSLFGLRFDPSYLMFSDQYLYDY